MDWMRRIGRPPAPGDTASGEPVREAVERTTPGVAALLDKVSADRSHAVLDLGPATNASLLVYSRFARWVRFADMVTAEIAAPEGWAAAMNALPPQPVRPYDLLFAWDILDRLPPAERPHLVERLAEISAADARLFLVVGSSGSATKQPLYFTLLDVDRMRFGATGPEQPASPPLLPAEVEKLLAPFIVERAFTSQVGLREYVAVRKPRPGRAAGVPPRVDR